MPNTWSGTQERRKGRAGAAGSGRYVEGGRGAFEETNEQGGGTLRRGNNLFRKKLDVAASQVTVAEKVVGGAWSDETSKVQMPTLI